MQHRVCDAKANATIQFRIDASKLEGSYGIDHSELEARMHLRGDTPRVRKFLQEPVVDRRAEADVRRAGFGKTAQQRLARGGCANTASRTLQPEHSAYVVLEGICGSSGVLCGNEHTKKEADVTEKMRVTAILMAAMGAGYVGGAMSQTNSRLASLWRDGAA